MRLISACFSLILLVSSLIPVQGFAQSPVEIKEVTGGQINEALAKTVPIRFLPSHPLYLLITLKESITRFFKPSSAERSEFDFILSGKRLKETYMLIEAGELDAALENLNRYNSRIGKMIEQLEKARSQNQDIGKQIAFISESLKNHEIFLIYFLRENDELKQDVIGAVESFKSAVLTINAVNPGIKDRFTILLITNESSEENSNVSPSPNISPSLNEASPSFKPKRIIL